MAISPWHTAIPQPGFEFRLFRGNLNDSNEAKRQLAGFLIHGLAHEGYLSDLFEKHGLHATAEYLKNRTFADKISTRIGDFGEIIAGRLLEAEEGLTRPVEKLRYKDSHNWSMKLTDIFCTSHNAGQISMFVLCEVKTGTTPPVRTLALDDYKKLLADSQADRPEIMFFTLEHLWAEGNLEMHQQLSEAMYRTQPLPKAKRLVLVFDDTAWRDEVFQELNDALKNGVVPPADDFICYLVTKAELRVLIEDLYALAEMEVINS